MNKWIGAKRKRGAAEKIFIKCRKLKNGSNEVKTSAEVSRKELARTLQILPLPPKKHGNSRVTVVDKNGVLQFELHQNHPDLRYVTLLFALSVFSVEIAG